MKRLFTALCLCAGLHAQAQESPHAADFVIELKQLEQKAYGELKTEIRSAIENLERRPLEQWGAFSCETGTLNMSDELVVEDVITLNEGEAQRLNGESNSKPKATVVSSSYQGDSVLLTLADAGGNVLPELGVRAGSSFHVSLGKGIALACGPKKLADERKTTLAKLVEGLDSVTASLEVDELERKPSAKKASVKRVPKSTRPVVNEPTRNLPIPLINGEPFDPNFLRDSN